jgi:hypothetical protein
MNRSLATLGLLSAFLFGVTACATKVQSVPEPISAQEVIVFDGHAGWQHGNTTYRLACGAIMTIAPNGDLLCAWLSGADKEPSPDNCVLLARSSDNGATWSEPTVLVPSGEMAGILTNLFTTDDGERVIALGAHWPASREYTEWHYFRIESGDNGMTWSQPVPIDLSDDGSRTLSIGHGQGPVRLTNGTYIYPGMSYDLRPQPLVAPAVELAHATSEAEALAMPAGEGRGGGKFSDYLMGCCVWIAPDDTASTWQRHGLINNRPLGLIEPTVAEMSDGRLVMLMRAEWGGFLWRADSEDGGITWSDAWQTDIPNAGSLVHLLRLTDGRHALLHNPTSGVVGQKGRRDPLSLWISDDDLQTWTIREDLLTGGQLAYPNAIQIDPNTLHFVYDHDRRQVRFVKVHIPSDK